MPIVAATICDPDVPANVIAQLRRMTGEMCLCATDGCQHMTDDELVAHIGSHQTPIDTQCGCGASIAHGCRFGFDLYGAAADIWRYKAQCVSHCAGQYSVDGQTIHDTRYDRYMVMAAEYESKRPISALYLSRDQHGAVDDDV